MGDTDPPPLFIHKNTVLCISVSNNKYTIIISDFELANLTNEELKRLTIPLNEDGEFHQCKRYDINFTEEVCYYSQLIKSNIF